MKRIYLYHVILIINWSGQVSWMMGIGMIEPGWDISLEPRSQAPTKSSDSHEIFAAIHAVLARI